METISDYTIYCTPEQTKKALELGALIKYYYDSRNLLLTPTAEQMIGYLRMRGFKFSFDDIYNYWAVSYDLKIINKGNSNNKELDAINAALEYLSNNKNN